VVYLPAGYDAAPAKRWPVFYFLHGLGGDETNWVSGGKLAEAADAMKLGAIVVMPDGDNGFYTDSATPTDLAACLADGTGLLDPRAPRKTTCVREPRYETYITKDLVDWVDATYRTIATRNGRAIAGLSMGGFGALQLAMRHQDVFAAAASHSGIDALLYAGPFPYVAGQVKLETDAAAWGGKLGPFGAWMRGIFGPDIASWRAHDPASLVDTLPPGALALYLDVGTEDEFALHNGAQYLHDLLTAKHIEHSWYIGPGHHDFTFWATRLPHSLAFLRDHVAAAN
jgi:S-formylglutathione hydrolase FrmB